MGDINIKMVDLNNQYLKIKKEIDSAIQEVIDSSQFIMGKQVGEFERNAAEYLNCKYAIGCASGTDALQIALMALDVKPGDEIITTPFTFVATTETIALLGAVPVYVDINEKSYNIDVNRIQEKINAKTKAIIPVHLYGQPSEMDVVMEIAKENKVKVIEDAAQAFGAVYKGKKVGSIGDIGTISFFPSKNLGAFGDAGMVTTNNAGLAEKMKMIITHGSKKKYYHEIPGVNSRLDTIQAAILNVKLKYIEQYHNARIKTANSYNERFNGYIEQPYVIPGVRHIYHQYSVRVPKRDELRTYLSENDIPSMIYYPVPLHLQQAYKNNYKHGDFPVAEKVAKDIISLPMHTELTDDQIDYISRKVIDFIKSK
jgi:UDP-2-acetamido-2-deoxy-ribo-hexuluronate aminotransferase